VRQLPDPPARLGHLPGARRTDAPADGAPAAESDFALTVQVRTHTPGSIEEPQTLEPRDDDGIFSTAVHTTEDGHKVEAPFYAELRDTPSPSAGESATG
jgi:hypothetical protein